MYTFYLKQNEKFCVAEQMYDVFWESVYHT